MLSVSDHVAWAYLIGGMGVIVEWRSYTLHEAPAFRHWSALAALLWALHYALLSAYTASLTMGTTALRTHLSNRPAQGGYHHWMATGFVLLFSCLTALSWQGYVSLLPAFAVINTTLALFYLNNRSMRICLLLSSIAWISNDWIWQAWPALLAESVAVLLNVRTINRLK